MWLIYSLVLIRGGLYRKEAPSRLRRLGRLCVGRGGQLFLGWIFEPISLYVPLFNLRSFFLGITLLALYLMGRWLTAEKKFRFKGLNIVIATLMGLFLFQMLTAETLDYYRQAAHLLRSRERPRRRSPACPTGAADVIHGLAFLLPRADGPGNLAPKTRDRLMAFGLFGLTVLKIFLFDLSFLETLYRIISFIGLGLILIGVSYVYSRYKCLFMPERENKAGPNEKRPKRTGTGPVLFPPHVSAAQEFIRGSCRIRLRWPVRFPGN